MKKIIILTIASLILASCSTDQKLSDGYGNFEVDEITISAKVGGEILKLDIEEGEMLNSGQKVGEIDSTLLAINKKQLQNNIKAIESKITSTQFNLQALKRQKEFLAKEKKRITELCAQEAATEQQKDKIITEYEVLELKLKALAEEISSVKIQKKISYNKLSEIKEKLNYTKIISPIKGVVLTKYKEEKELATQGMPLFKIANLEKMFLKIYVSGSQLDDIKIGQKVEVLIDRDKKSNHKLSGTITWISSQAEFTPKNIQTKEERIDQVYAVKILVKNNGKIKIGMPGEVNF